MSVSTMFTFGASSASTYCEKQVDSPISSKDLSRKRKEFEPDYSNMNVLSSPPRSATMPEYDHEEKQRRRLKQRQSRQTRSQTVAHRIEAERVQQELDAYLDHIKSLASMIEMQQHARQVQRLSAHQSSPETEARAMPSRRRTRVGNLSISTQNDSEDNDADNEWEPYEKWKVRVHPKTTEGMYNTLQPATVSEWFFLVLLGLGQFVNTWCWGTGDCNTRMN